MLLDPKADQSRHGLFLGQLFLQAGQALINGLVGRLQGGGGALFASEGEGGCGGLQSPL